MTNPIKDQFLYANTSVFPVHLNDKVAVLYHDDKAPEVDGVKYGKELGTVIMHDGAYAVLTNDGDIVQFDNPNVRGVILAHVSVPRSKMTKEQLLSMPDIAPIIKPADPVEDEASDE